MNDYKSRGMADYLLEAEAKHQRAYMRRVILGLLLGAFLGGSILYAAKSHAVQLDQMGCMALAVWSHDVVLMRDVGADKEKVRAYFKEQDTKEQPVFGLLLREFDKLWATTEPKESVAQPVYLDCVKRRGVYGTDV